MTITGSLVLNAMTELNVVEVQEGNDCYQQKAGRESGKTSCKRWLWAEC